MALISNTGIKEIFQARLIIESGLVEIAAAHISDADLKIIAGEIKAMCDTIGDPEEFLKHDVCFHQKIARVAGNKLMSSIVDTILQLLLQLRGQKNGRAADLQEAIIWHERIYRALKRRDGKRAKELISSHLCAAERDWDHNSESRTSCGHSGLAK